MKFISNSNDLSRFLEIPIAKNIPLRSISLDSRTIKKGALFFAIKGKNFNGNHFVDIAFNKGASIIIADDKKFLKTKNNRIIYVKNTIQALKKISENIIAESMSNLSIGCSVIFELNSLFKQSSIKFGLFNLISLNSGKYRPACLMNHIDLQFFLSIKIFLRLLIK